MQENTKHNLMIRQIINYMNEYSGAFTFLCCRTAYGISPDRNLRDRQVNLASSLKMFTALTIWYLVNMGRLTQMMRAIDGLEFVEHIFKHDDELFHDSILVT